MAKNKPQFALIGVSGYAHNYVVNLTRLQDAGQLDIAAAVIRNQAKAPETVEDFKKRGVRIYASTAEMYAGEKQLDVVCIPTGIGSHEPMTLEALEHGCHVIVEKPVSGTVESVDRMIAAAKAHPKQFVMVGFQHMYDRNLWYLKSLLLAGKLGAIKKICVHGVWPRNDKYYGRNNWAAKIHDGAGALVLDSPVNNAFAHYLNIALFMAGDLMGKTAAPAEIQAELLRARDVEMFDSCAFKVKTVNDIPIVAFLCHTALENSEPQLRIECEKGTINWQMGAGWKVVDSEENVIASGVTGRSNADMFDDAVKKLTNPEQFTCTLEMARNHTMCIEAMYKHFQVFDFPKELVHRREEDGQFYVDGLETFGMKCFLSGELFLAPKMSKLPPAVKL